MTPDGGRWAAGAARKCITISRRVHVQRRGSASRFDMFNPFKKKPPARFPPVPDWRPSIRQPLDRLIERFNYYYDGTRDFAVFANGTCAVLPDGLSESEAIKTACEILAEI